MKKDRSVQRYFFIEPRKWRQHARLDALRRQLEIATEELKRDPERASRVAALAEEYRRAHASWVGDLRAGRPKKDRSTIVNRALEIWKVAGRRAAVEFVRTSIKANEGIELTPATCSDLLYRSKGSPITGVRLSPGTESAVATWAGQQSDKPSKAEAVRRLVELGLETALAQIRLRAEHQTQHHEKDDRRP